MAVRVECRVTFTFRGFVVDPKTPGVLSTVTEKPLASGFCDEERMDSFRYMRTILVEADCFPGLYLAGKLAFRQQVYPNRLPKVGAAEHL
jgi:hypothetical protein